ncbi:HlyD family secretion protein [Klebsiella quasipneumoniae]|uniref:HlyD family secretion protein n=1 Tax=Klebsiella quasipneumoniae TaxID=1463165 RepID=UPI000D74948D|nr:HlyD family secretion protein [Klebsiella quasipneumoniae]MDD9217589.1 HlyD family secretion protein [Klebsiella quasipneumoniae]MDR4843799.1 HlyD family secretion protein [Klebsiella quasipneumoniae]PXH82749.1 HlyD family secretion protein [Klebsiella quasipneumoniae]UAA04426.1 HlyD family secretion protein [Klebsiella quasipneumoniae]HCI6216835.1 HlyD family secretion protein [Klebsiella quasipneumoniae subsp. quasipneumoniae]
MGRKLYRKEAIDYKKNQWKGKALLLAGMPAWLVFMISSAFLLILILTLRFCSYTQRIDVKGEVITLPHSINVFAPQQGFVVKKLANVGDVVHKGTPLYELDVSRSTINGNVNTTMTAAINEKIENAEEIIIKILKNKEETMEALNTQLQQYAISLKETNTMLNNASTGLKKMKENLSSYDQYLSQGLITKDQYNYQHSLYFQQQSTYQSLISQKMQLESQLTQLKSDVVIKAADFDNQVSNQKNQINDYKNQRIEANANGNIIIKATANGKVESVAVTVGQMVDKGSSLAQIKPTENVEYYLILWLPNNSIPYIKPGDTVNIRYDAFPSDKFGQFPGKVLSISSVPASRQEMSEYTNVVTNPNQQELALYKAIVKINNSKFIYKDTVLELSNGLKAQAIVFLEERPLYMWMFTPLYKITQSVSGPINE